VGLRQERTMDRKEMLEKLERITESITAKGHPMQDASTMKMALLDLIDVVKKLAEGK
jgi:hypothetical protein